MTTTTLRTIETTRLVHDEDGDGFYLQAWHIEHLTGFGACLADGEDRWSHTATVTLYTDGHFGVARANRSDLYVTTDLAAAMACAKRL